MKSPEQSAVDAAVANLAECQKHWEAARTPEFQQMWNLGVELSEKKLRGALTPEEEQRCWDIWDSEEVASFGKVQNAVMAAHAQLKAAKKALKESSGAGSSPNSVVGDASSDSFKLPRQEEHAADPVTAALAAARAAADAKAAARAAAAEQLPARRPRGKLGDKFPAWLRDTFGRDTRPKQE